MKKKDFPEQWHLKLDDNNRHLVDKWRKQTFDFNSNFDSDNYVLEDGTCWIRISDIFEVGELITTQDFLKYVINNQEEYDVTEDTKYLIKFLKKLNIK